MKVDLDEMVAQTIAIRKILNKKLPKHDKWAVSKAKVRKEVLAKIKENKLKAQGQGLS